MLTGQQRLITAITSKDHEELKYLLEDDHDLYFDVNKFHENKSILTLAVETGDPKIVKQVLNAPGLIAGLDQLEGGSYTIPTLYRYNSMLATQNTAMTDDQEKILLLLLAYNSILYAYVSGPCLYVPANVREVTNDSAIGHALKLMMCQAIVKVELSAIAALYAKEVCITAQFFDQFCEKIVKLTGKPIHITNQKTNNEPSHADRIVNLLQKNLAHFNAAKMDGIKNVFANQKYFQWDSVPSFMRSVATNAVSLPKQATLEELTALLQYNRDPDLFPGGPVTNECLSSWSESEKIPLEKRKLLYNPKQIALYVSGKDEDLMIEIQLNAEIKYALEKIAEHPELDKIPVAAELGINVCLSERIKALLSKVNQLTQCDKLIIASSAGTQEMMKQSMESIVQKVEALSHSDKLIAQLSEQVAAVLTQNAAVLAQNTALINLVKKALEKQNPNAARPVIKTKIVSGLFESPTEGTNTRGSGLFDTTARTNTRDRSNSI